MVFGFSRKASLLGIDVSTSSIKIVELKHTQEGFELVNYGVLKNYGYIQRFNNPIQTSSLKMFDEEVSDLIKKILKAAQIERDKRAIFSIPLFSSFITVIEMKGITDKEVASAIRFEARQYVPVPLADVVLAWMILENNVPGFQESQNGQKAESVGTMLDKTKSKDRGVKVLLIAVPKEIVNQYGKIADLAGLRVEVLESEAFSLLRSLATNEKQPLAIVDIGSRSTNIVFVNKGAVRLTHNLDIAGGEITALISHNLNIDYMRAEELKNKQGLSWAGGESEISSIILPIINKIFFEIKHLLDDFLIKEGAITKIILSGGSANMPGLVDYLAKLSGVPVMLGDPFRNVSYPVELKPIVNNLAPSFAVAIGAAMRKT